MKSVHTTPRVKRGRRKSGGQQGGTTAAYVVSTLAGNGSGNWIEGTGTAAAIHSPRSIAVTPSGSIVIAESNSSAIRLVTQAGVTSTLAGPKQIQSLGSQDGQGRNASFYQANAMTCAPDGTIYTADSSYHLIRRITPDGTATTIAGTGGQNNTDGVGRSASFNRPQAVCINPGGNILYVGDTDNQMVRQISIPSYAVTTFCTQVQAMGIAVGRNGIVYISSNDHRIYSLPVGSGGRTVRPTVFVGNGSQGYSDGQGTGCAFNQPKQLAIDSANNLYLADSGNNMVRMITPAGAVTTVVGNQSGGFVDGLKAVARFNYPWGVAIDSGGNLYIGDSNNNRIRKLALIMPPSAPAVRLISRDSIGATITWTGGTSLVPTVYSYSINGGTRVALPTTITRPPVTIPMPSGGATFNVSLIASNDAGSTPSVPAGQASGTLSVTTAPTMRSSAYTFVGIRGNAGSVNGVGTVASLNNPYGVTMDTSGNAYIADTNNHCIRRVTPYGLTTTFAGMPTVAGYVDNTLTTAQFRNPRDITLDSAGNMYVTDTGNNVIRKISPLGVVTTFAGNTSAGSSDGTGPAADFNNPTSITCDPSGNVFVADTNNHCIRKITPAGAVTTFAGTNNSALTDGAGRAARFNSPCGIAYDAFSRNLYVADTNNHCIRIVTLNGVVTTLAGNNSNGMTNGIGTVADFNAPTGIATDLSGYIYVSDSNNHLIRKVAPGGLVSTYSGSGQGWADGSTTAAQFNSIQSNVQHNTPTGMATDASGNLYVTETGNHILRIITPIPRPVPPTSITIGGVTTNSATINWSGGSGATSFTFAMFPPTPGIIIPVVASSPGMISGLSDGTRYTVYVVSMNAGGPILSNPFSFVTTISPPVVTVGPKDAIVTNPTANNPVPGDATALIRWTGAAVADSITYQISPNDAQNRSSVRMPNNQTSPYLITNMRPGTTYTVSLAATKANVPGANPAAYTASSQPFSFTTPAAQTVTVYPIAGIANNRGRTNDISGAKCTFEMPRGIAMDGNGVLYVSDRIIVRQITGPPGISYFSFARGVPGAVPRPLEKTPILPGPRVGDYVGSREGGQPSYSPRVGANARFYNIYGLTFDPFSGCLYATDKSYHYIIKITPGAGGATAAVIAGNNMTYTNGTGNGANFSQPQGICAGKNGLIYIADTGNNCIRVMTPSGSVTTAAGPEPGRGVATNAATNGPASTVGFNAPTALVADAVGNIYIADTNNHCIRYLNNANSTVMTIAGGGTNGNSSGYSDGQGLNAFFRNPCGITLDASGNIYVYDAGNYRIRRVTPTGYVTSVAGNGSSGSTFGAGNTINMSSNMDTEHCGLCSDGLGNIYFADSGSAMIKVISTAPKPLASTDPAIAAAVAEQQRLQASAAAQVASAARASQAAVVASQAQVVASQAAVEASQAAQVASSALQQTSQAQASQALQVASQAKVLGAQASQAAIVASQASKVASSAQQIASQAQASQALQQNSQAQASSALQQSSQAQASSALQQSSQAQASQAAQAASSALQQNSQARASQALQAASHAQASSALQQASQAQASQAAQVASSALQQSSQAQASHAQASSALQQSSQAQASSALQAASSALQQSSQAQASRALQVASQAEASMALQQASQAQASSALQQASQAQASQAAQVASSALQQSSQAQASQAQQVASSALQVASQAYQAASAAIKAAVEKQQYEVASQAQQVASAALARDTASSALQQSSQAQASQALQAASSALQQSSQAQASQALQQASQAQASSALQVASSALQQSSQAQASSALQQSSQAQASMALQQSSQAQASSALQQASQAQASQAAQEASSALQQSSQAQASMALQQSSQAQASQARASQAAQEASSALQQSSQAQASSALQQNSQAQASQALQQASSALQQSSQAQASQAQASQAAQAASSALQLSSQAQASQAAQAASSALQQSSQAEASMALQQSSQAEASRAQASSALERLSRAQASMALQQNSQAQASQAAQYASSALQQNSQAQASQAQASQAQYLSVSQAMQAASSAKQQAASAALQVASQAEQVASQALEVASQAQVSQAQASQAAQAASSALQQSSQAEASSALQQNSQAQASSALQQSSQAQASQAAQTASSALQQSSQAQASQAQASQAQASQAQASSALQQSSQAQASSALQQSSQAQASQALQVASQAQASQAIQVASQAQASQAQVEASQALQLASQAYQAASAAIKEAVEKQQYELASQAQQVASSALARDTASSALQQSSQAQASQARASQALQAASSALEQSSQAQASQAAQAASSALEQSSQAEASSALQQSSQAEASSAMQQSSQAEASQALQQSSQAQASSAIKEQASSALQQSSQAQASQALQQSSQAQASSALQQSSQAQASQALQQSSQAEASQAQASQAEKVASQAQASQAAQEASQALVQASQAAQLASQAEAVQVAEAIQKQASEAQLQASQAQASQALQQSSQAQASSSLQQSSQAQASQAQASSAFQQASQARVRASSAIQRASQAAAVQASQAAAVQASQAAAVQASTAYAANLAGLTSADVTTSSTAATTLGNIVQAEVASLTASGNYVGASTALTSALQALRSSPAFVANDPTTVALVTTLTNVLQTTITTNPNGQASAATEASAITTGVTSLQGSNPAIYSGAAAEIQNIANSQVSTLLAAGSYTQAANTLSSMIAQVMSSNAFKSNDPAAVALVNSLAVMKQNAIAADPSTAASVKASQAALAVQQIQAAAAAIQAASSAVAPAAPATPAATPEGATPATPATPAAPATPATPATPAPSAPAPAAPAPAASGAPAPTPADATPESLPEAGEAEILDLSSGYGYGETPVEGTREMSIEEAAAAQAAAEAADSQGGGGKPFRKSRRRIKGKSRRKSRSKARKNLN